MTNLNPEVCGQTDWSFFMEQNVAENAKIEIFKWDILGDFQSALPDRSILIDQKLVKDAKIEMFK